MSDPIVAIGLMSGTSLDGLDLAAVEFRFDGKQWAYKTLAVEGVHYSADWQQRLRTAPDLSIREGYVLHTQYGRWLGEQVQRFVSEHQWEQVLVVGSHGHTVLHRPAEGYTWQIGDGSAIAAASGLPVVTELRSMDVALEGQGAPIVPVAERYLFPKHRIFLNLGGIANISCHLSDAVLAYDIGPANTPLNFLARLTGHPYDKGGHLSRRGEVHEPLLEKLDAFSFYGEQLPRSLHTDRIVQEFMPALKDGDIPIQDRLHTVTEHIARKVGRHIQLQAEKCPEAEGVMITGGGAFNGYLIERIRQFTEVPLHLPDPSTIAYKEAIAMAFLAVLRVKGIPNVLASVTGARRDSVNGALYGTL